MQLTKEIINTVCSKYGDSFYLLDTDKFKRNFLDLQASMRKYYKKTHIAYSYKTNYIPRLCEIVNELGGYAEVVSGMESDIALRIGVSPDKIIFNGPYKEEEATKKLLLSGATINIDSLYDFNIVLKLAKDNPDKIIGIGVRCNFDVNDGVISRFGFDIESDIFKKVLDYIQCEPNLKLKGFHCHFATRYLDTWKLKVSKMMELVKNMYDGIPEYICFGGGLFGNMDETLKKQFNSHIPSFDEYAEVIAKPFYEEYYKYPEQQQPILFIEPGSALAGDAMQFIAKIINIKEVRGKNIATLLGSVYNINPTLNGKNPPIKIVNTSASEQKKYTNLDFAGYTCIESDYLYKGFNGLCIEGDHVIFSNIGSYSIVLKPPFILPNFPVLELNADNNSVKVIKYGETFDDLFNTYIF